MQPSKPDQMADQWNRAFDQHWGEHANARFGLRCRSPRRRRRRRKSMPVRLFRRLVSRRHPEDTAFQAKCAKIQRKDDHHRLSHGSSNQQGTKELAASFSKIKKNIFSNQRFCSFIELEFVNSSQTFFLSLNRILNSMRHKNPDCLLLDCDSSFNDALIKSESSIDDVLRASCCFTSLLPVLFPKKKLQKVVKLY